MKTKIPILLFALALMSSLVLLSRGTLSTITAGAAGTVVGDDTPRSGAVKINAIITAVEGITAVPADGAIPITTGSYFLNKTSAGAYTVAAPSSQDGTILRLIGGSDFAHVVTFTGTTLLDGTTGANLTVTFTAFAGGALTVQAKGTKWYVLSQNNLTSIAP